MYQGLQKLSVDGEKAGSTKQEVLPANEKRWLLVCTNLSPFSVFQVKMATSSRFPPFWFSPKIFPWVSMVGHTSDSFFYSLGLWTEKKRQRKKNPVSCVFSFRRAAESGTASWSPFLVVVVFVLLVAGSPGEGGDTAYRRHFAFVCHSSP